MTVYDTREGEKLDRMVVGWILIAAGVATLVTGLQLHKEGSQRWFAANADLIVTAPGFAMYIAGLCMIFSQI